jgi:hypothetical protein
LPTEETTPPVTKMYFVIVQHSLPKTTCNSVLAFAKPAKTDKKRGPGDLPVRRPLAIHLSSCAIDP